MFITLAVYTIIKSIASVGWSTVEVLSTGVLLLGGIVEVCHSGNLSPNYNDGGGHSDWGQ